MMSDPGALDAVKGVIPYPSTHSVRSGSGQAPSYFYIVLVLKGQKLRVAADYLIDWSTDAA